MSCFGRLGSFNAHYSFCKRKYLITKYQLMIGMEFPSLDYLIRVNNI